MSGKTGLIIVAGRRAGAACGVSDYSDHLASALQTVGVRARVLDARDWTLRGFLRTLLLLRRAGAVHLQHPSGAFERRLLPYLLLAATGRTKRFVTFHEFSKKSRIGTILTYPLVRAADRIFTTNARERDALIRTFPFTARKIDVIPIGSNIPVAAAQSRTTDLCYFGQIRAGKGIEDFLAIAAALGPGLRTCLMGSVPPGDTAAQALLGEAEAMGMTTVIDAASAQVAQQLAETRIALLPFPDGISERRGSALAAMANETLVVTTPPLPGAGDFDGICLMGRSRDDLRALIEAVLSGEIETAGIVAAARHYVSQRTWPAIATQQLDGYGAAGTTDAL